MALPAARSPAPAGARQVCRYRPPSGGGPTWVGSMMASAPMTPMMPSAALLVTADDVALLDLVVRAYPDLGNSASGRGLDRDLHLHRLQDGDGVAHADGLADLHVHLPNVGRDLGPHLCHGARVPAPHPITGRSHVPIGPHI